VSYLINLSVFIAAFWLSTVSLAAERTAEVSSLAEPFDLANYIEYLADPNDQITYDDIMQGRYEGQWRLNTEPVFIVHDFHMPYWFRVRINSAQNVNALNPAIHINIQPTLIRDLSMWIPQINQAAKRFDTGYLNPYYNRDVSDSSQYAFRLPNLQGEFTLVGRLDPRSAAQPIILPLQLMTEKQLQQSIIDWNYVSIAFYSVMCALLFYNSLLFISLRLSLYGYYVAFLIAAIYTCASIDSTVSKWLWSERVATGVYCGDIVAIFLGIFYLAFVYEALDKMQVLPRLRKCYYVMFVLGGFLLLHNVLSPSYFWTNAVAQLYTCFIIPLTLASILFALKLKLPLAGYLLLAELSAIIGGVIFLLMVQGFTPVSFWFLWATYFGFVGEAMMLSLALAARTRISQEQAMENLRRFETLYQESAGGLFEYDVKTQKTHANRAFARLFGYQTIDEIPLTDNPLHLLNEKEQQDLPRRLLETGRIVGYEMEIYRPETQDKIWISIDIRLVFDETQKPLRVEGAVTDITERKLVERAQRQVTENLRQSDNLKNEFLATMSHELRTPMNGILGGIELLQLEQPAANEPLKLLSSSAAEMMKLVNRILDFIQLQAGTVKNEPSIFSLTEMLEDFALRYTDRCRSKELQFTYLNETNVDLTVRGDRKKLTQIVEELLDNAYRFTQTGSVTLSLAVEPYCDSTDTAGNERSCKIIVEDTGVGVSVDDQKKIFHAFTQADSSFSRSHYGMGLGLVSCKRFAEIMGGTLTLESQLGKGSKVSLLLNMEVLSKPQKIDPLTASELTHKKLLIVEDNITNQLVLKGILQKLGYETAVAENGLKALDYLSHNTIDLILMDCQMPEMDGFETTTRIRVSEEAFKHIPIIAVTANTMSGDRERCLAIGMNDYLGKPVRKDLLQEKLSYWLHRTSSGE